MDAHHPIFPKFILIFSGKRKSGKDFVTERLQKLIGMEQCAIIRLSGPLKKQYAKEHNLDFKKLLDSSDYKEKYRLDMINWGEKKRIENQSYFCQLATEGEDRPVWIISDARRWSDMEYFQKVYGANVRTVRVTACVEARHKRGWIFTEGIDEAVSECGLDNFTHDVTITNDGDLEQLDQSLSFLVAMVNNSLDDCYS